MTLRFYNELRRAWAVNNAIIDLALDVFISRLYQQKGLGHRSWKKRLAAGIIRRILRRQKTRAPFPVQFRRTLERLGPTYVKLGQILSLREDMLPERICKELRKLQNQVPPISFKEVKQVIESEFNLPLSLIFAEFEPEPIAAASLAQAHIARLKTGEKVVVKVQRPGIQRLIIDDINIMRRLAAIMEKIPGLRDYRPAHFVEEFASYTMRELDFTQEGKHADTFRQNFADWPEVIFPKIYWQYTSRRVLTMEFIEGIKPDDAKKIKALGIDGKRIAEIGARAIIKMLFIDGFFHGDPHPGNMMIVDKNKICFIDLGMIGSYSPETRRNMFLYYYFMVIREFEHATRFLVNLTEPGPKADEAGFRRELAEAIKQWSSAANFKEYSMGRLIFDTMNIGARYQLYFHGDLVLSSKAIITIEAVGAILHPDMDLSEISRPMMEEIFRMQLSPRRFTQALLKALPDYLEFFENLPKTVLKATEIVSDGKIQVNLPAEVKTKKTNKSFSQTWGIFSLVSLVLGALLAVNPETPGPIVESLPFLAGLPVLALLFLGAGFLGGFWWLWKENP